MKNKHGVAGLDWWIAQSGLQSSLVDWIVIDSLFSKLGFGLLIHFFHWNWNLAKNSFSIYFFAKT
jgi:hypothetical protein